MRLTALAAKWAVYASKDSYALSGAKINVAMGVVFILLYLLGVDSTRDLLWMAAVLFAYAILLFERAGFISIIGSIDKDIQESSSEQNNN